MTIHETVPTAKFDDFFKNFAIYIIAVKIPTSITVKLFIIEFRRWKIIDEKAMKTDVFKPQKP